METNDLELRLALDGGVVRASLWAVEAPGGPLEPPSWRAQPEVGLGDAIEQMVHWRGDVRVAVALADALEPTLMHVVGEVLVRRKNTLLVFRIPDPRRRDSAPLGLPLRIVSLQGRVAPRFD